MTDRGDFGRSSDVTNAELYRLVRDMRSDLRQFVTNDRYLAEQKAQDDRMKDLATEVGDIRAGNRRAFYTALSALILPLLFLVLTIYLTGGSR